MPQTIENHQDIPGLLAQLAFADIHKEIGTRFLKRIKKTLGGLASHEQRYINQMIKRNAGVLRPVHD
jgi:hypothetical protein